MNKKQFLMLLRKEISSMPIKEQNELLDDYETHFAFGQQAGKTEEEISLELGDPLALAVEAMEEYYRNSPTNTIKSVTASRTILSIVGLFLLNFVLAVVPLGLAIWATWLSLLLAAALVIASPILALADCVLNSYFSGGKLFLSIAFSGVGIFFIFGVLYIGKLLKRITVAYYNWNVRVIRGGK